MKKILPVIWLVFSATFLFAQQTSFPVNGSFDTRPWDVCQPKYPPTCS